MRLAIASIAVAACLSSLLQTEVAKADENARAKKGRPYVTFSGEFSQIKKDCYRRITAKDEWKSLWMDHKGVDPKKAKPADWADMPEVDLDQCMVIAVVDSCEFSSTGFVVDSIMESPDLLTIRVQSNTYQTGVISQPFTGRTCEKQGENLVPD
jgi:hypothetical protein